MMLRNPAFTLLASLSLALGIGANTAIYSFMDALLMRSLPVRDPGSLVLLKWHITAKKGTDNTVVHHADGYFDKDPKTGRHRPSSRTRHLRCCGIKRRRAFHSVRVPSGGKAQRRGWATGRDHGGRVRFRRLLPRAPDGDDPRQADWLRPMTTGPERRLSSCSAMDLRRGGLGTRPALPDKPCRSTTSRSRWSAWHRAGSSELTLPSRQTYIFRFTPTCCWILKKARHRSTVIGTNTTTGRR